ncbi:beta-ketoacyl synthase N-terminal-like domain-containing protein, partial [Micromonospora haikouensis]
MVVLVGGDGNAGPIVRQLTAGHGIRRLVLGRAPGVAAPDTAELTASGVTVTVVPDEISDRAGVAALLAAVAPEHPPTAVVFVGDAGDGPPAGGAADDAGAASRLQPALAWHLHDLAGGTDLPAFVLLGPAGGILGTPGGGDRAATGAFLDALARHRSARGLAALSIGWGPWHGPDDTDPVRESRHGLRAVPVAHLLAVVELGLTDGRHPGLLPVALDQAELRRHARSMTLPTVFRDLVPAPAAPTGVGGPALGRQLRGRPEPEQTRIVLDLVLTQIAAVLGHENPGSIAPTRPLQELGFDSLTAVGLRNRLQEATQLTLPATLLFDYPTATAMAAHLRSELLGTQDVTAVPLSAKPVDDEPIVIVGMGCRYPGGVRSPEDLWQLVADGRDAITEFPTDRGWDLDALYDPDPEHPGTSYVRTGGFLHDAPLFDADFFGISPREALAMDPQQRLLLETSWETFENAGINPESLRGSRTGVFTGTHDRDYGTLVAGNESLEGYLIVGNSASILSGRLSYTYGFEGPAISLDTACSSSLVALHLAVQALRSGECDLALAGGVSVLATPASFVEFSRQRGLAPDGRAKSFAAGADGTSWSEGVGLLLVERLSDAHRHGHRILAVVRGSAVNQDGTTSQLSAPNGPAQQRVIRQALTTA